MTFGSMTLKAKAALQDRSGNVAMIFAFMAIPIIGFIGLATDYGMESNLKNRMQGILDSAALNGVAQLSGGPDAEAVASALLADQFQKLGISPSVSVTVNSREGTIRTTAETKVSTLFMGLLGQPEVTVSASSTAVAGAGGPMDVAIAFDTTFSMDGDKLTHSQLAAKDMVDLLFKVPGSSEKNPHMKVGLVPFASYVNVGLSNRGASWLTGSDDVAGPDWCRDTYEQIASHTETYDCSLDGTPRTCTYDTTDDYSRPNGTVCTPTTRTWHGCVGSQPSPNDAHVGATAANPVPALLDTWCTSELTRLSDDPATVKQAISDTTADGETYIAPGILWGWRVLSDDGSGPFHDGGPAATTRKRLILMTDGTNTHSARYPDHEGSDVAAANQKVKDVCASMKAAHVQIYAIAFDVTDTTIKDLLAECSSGPPYYYDANTMEEMEKAFKKIGRELTATRLVK